MKSRKSIILILILFTNPAWSLTFMGSPTSNVKQGDLLLGFDYSNGEVDVQFSGMGEEMTLKGVETDIYLGKLGLGAADGFEVFGRFGLSEIDNGENEFAWGVGTKLTLGKWGNLRWGALFQFIMLTADQTENVDLGGGLVSIDSDLEIYEFQIAAGPSYDLGPLCIYGGPFAHFIDGDLEADLFGFTVPFDIEQESEFGGYIGLSWNLHERTGLSVEYQATSDADVIGFGLVHRFGGSPKPEKSIAEERITPKPTLKLDIDADGRPIKTYRLQRDASGDFAKKPDGGFIIVPVYQDERN